MDPLFIKQFTPSVSKQPINTHYQTYDAESVSASGSHWNIDCPFAGALLDSEVLVEYTLTFNTDATGASIDPAANVADTQIWPGMFAGASTANIASRPYIRHCPYNSYKFAPRSGFCVGSALQNCEVVINGQSMRQTPFRFMPEFARFYASDAELSSVCSMSGGELDSGTFSTMTAGHFGRGPGGVPAPAVGGVAAAQLGIASCDWPVSGEEVVRVPVPVSDPNTGYWNSGFGARFNRFKRRVRDFASASDEDNGVPLIAAEMSSNPAYGGGRELTFVERVPIAPFLLWEAKDGKRSIPFVDKMELSLTWYSNAGKLMFQTDLPDNILDNVRWWLKKPKLHLKWYIPPPGMMLPPEISIPVTQYKELVRTVTLPDVAVDESMEGAASTVVSYENIRLQQVPDLIFIYIKPSAADLPKAFSNERHAEILAVDITVNGDTGKALRAGSARLFSMYRRNSPQRGSRRFDYDEWRKRYCTVALRPHDLGVRVPPGVNHGVTLDVRVTAKSWSQQATHHPSFGPNAGRLAGAPVGNALGPNPLAGNRLSVYHEGSCIFLHNWDLTIIGVYDKYELTLTNRGNAQLKLQNVPSVDMPQSLAQVDRTDLRAQFA